MSAQVLAVEAKRIAPLVTTSDAVVPLTIRMTNSYPDIMTEAELIEYLRIPCVSKSKNYKNVVDNLVAKWGLPCIHISLKRLFPLALVRQWVCGGTI